jgi:hypothetical protein
MSIIAFKIFATCLIIFVVCTIIEDATLPSGTPLIIIKLIGGLGVMVGFVALVATMLSLIWS